MPPAKRRKQDAVARTDLTSLRRNVALFYVRFDRYEEDGRRVEHRDRRPPWSNFQQRLVSPDDINFIYANPLDAKEMRQVLIRCLGNLKAAGHADLDECGLEAYTRDRDYDRADREIQLLACERLQYKISEILREGMPALILAYVDLHVLTWELDSLLDPRVRTSGPWQPTEIFYPRG